MIEEQLKNIASRGMVRLMNQSFRIAFSFINLFVLLTLAAFAQSGSKFPERDLTFIVQSAPGGPSDFVSQLLSKPAEAILGKNLGLRYRPGASGALGMSELKNAIPDGYTIGLVAGDLSLIKSLEIADLTPHDFTPIMLVLKLPAVVAVSADSPIKSLKDLAAYQKNAKRALTFSNSGTGSIWRMAGVALANKLNFALSSVPFDGVGPAKTALLGKHVDLMVAGLGDILEETRAGRLRVLAVMSEQRISFANDIPTALEQGVSLEFGSWLGIAGPKNLDPAIQKTLYSTFKAAFDNPRVRSAYEARGYMHQSLGPDQFKKFINDQFEKLAPIARKLKEESK